MIQKNFIAKYAASTNTTSFAKVRIPQTPKITLYKVRDEASLYSNNNFEIFAIPPSSAKCTYNRAIVFPARLIATCFFILFYL